LAHAASVASREPGAAIAWADAAVSEWRCTTHLRRRTHLPEAHDARNSRKSGGGVSDAPLRPSCTGACPVTLSPEWNLASEASQEGALFIQCSHYTNFIMLAITITMYSLHVLDQSASSPPIVMHAH
jgi:hypothetical protein